VSLIGGFHQEACGVCDLVAHAVVVDVVVAVEVVAAGLLVAEAEIERCGAVVVIVDASPSR
jgi:hypothetical protein